MLTVTNVENIEIMRKYILDPVNNPIPKMKINSIKDYKEVAESLYKLVQGTGGTNGKPSPMLDALNTDLKLPEDKKKIENKDDDISVTDLLEMENEEESSH